jgi:P-type E1-E2 ATPase
MIKFEVPGLGAIELHHLVSDFTGTLSVDGRLLPGVKDLLNNIAESLKVHIVTADTFGTARKELERVDCEVHMLSGADHDRQKEEFVITLGRAGVIAIGNGNNDRRMLKSAKIGVAVCLKEGCAADAVKSADILTTSAVDALELLLNPRRMKATLRF